MRGLLELAYYFVGFLVADILINLAFGNGVDFIGSLIGTAIFMAAYVVLMLGWRFASKKFDKQHKCSAHLCVSVFFAAEFLYIGQ